MTQQPNTQQEALETKAEASNTPIDTELPKKGFFSRLKGRFAKNTPVEALQAEETTKDREQEKQKRKMAALLCDIESQIMGLDEQNKVLMYHIATMRENNDALLEQLRVLKKNNDILTEQFQATLKKSRTARILNTIYTSLAIAFVLYRMIIMMIN